MSGFFYITAEYTKEDHWNRLLTRGTADSDGSDPEAVQLLDHFHLTASLLDLHTWRMEAPGIFKKLPASSGSRRL